jgi:aminoglycoside 6'-N-acetyltransferase
MDRSISFRSLSRSDFPLLQQWLGNPHVAAWWHQPLDLAGVEAMFGPRVDGIEPTHVFVIEYREQPVGWIQWYFWSDYVDHARQLGVEEPDSVGVDLAIGEEEMMGKGLGPSVIDKFLDQIVFIDPTVTSVFTDPEETNARSLRAFEKAGFTVVRKVKLSGETFQRNVVFLDRPLRRMPD